ncbi:OmpA family protein [Flavobacterium caeni]|uniref:OmpA-OmpF porin, OOP family n=1 Tax=Flavobacterium caeni TaxID=490189 RepID=A0A1G5D460_9FLAO|nr:OmpA family protein [Flavobacterium caeni]SCY09298.1 OmpA-OmpF porin, OOP family [Flavobacterium caeni]
MKKNLLFLSAAFLVFTNVSAQDDPKKDDIKDANDEVVEHATYNKWTVEVTAGQSKGTKPYSDGYYSSSPDKVLGAFKFNSFGLAARYMFSPKFGLRLGGTYDKFENITGSKPFETQQLRFDVQGVVNSARLLGIEEQLGRFNMLIHGGFVYARFTPKLDTGIDPQLQDEPGEPGGPSNIDRTENNLGVMIGVSPEFRITKKISIIGDFSTITNFRQHFAWDGHYADRDHNLSGHMIAGSIGLTYSFGSDELHGDWAIIEDPKSKEFEELDKRIGDLETMLNDADKDGVPDYLDVENNSIAGVAVDTKGRMVDINKNGIPDELENYLQTNFATKETITQAAATANEEMVRKLINDGYVTTYFDFNKTKPTNVSTEGIDFMLTYLRNNPSASIDIIGNADEIGSSPYNVSLANKRAESVKAILVKAGIPASRLNVVSKGEDSSVDPDSAGARKLVRRVTFKVRQ